MPAAVPPGTMHFETPTTPTAADKNAKKERRNATGKRRRSGHAYGNTVLPHLGTVHRSTTIVAYLHTVMCSNYSPFFIIKSGTLQSSTPLNTLQLTALHIKKANHTSPFIQRAPTKQHRVHVSNQSYTLLTTTRRWCMSSRGKLHYYCSRQPQKLHTHTQP